MSTQWLILCFLFALPLLAQEKPDADRLKGLEMRIMVIEDYLKNRLDRMEEKLDGQSKSLEKALKENASLLRDLSSAQERLKTLEAEMLRVKIELAILKKGEPLASESGTKNASQGTVAEVRKEESPYRDPEVRKLFERLTSPESSIRLGAVVGLSASESPESVRALMHATKDHDMHVKMLACKALLKKKSKEAAGLFLELMKEENRQMQIFARQCLQELTGVHEESFDDRSKKGIEESVERWREKLKSMGWIK